MFTPFIFWPWFAGLVFLAAGILAVRREFSTAARLDKAIVWGRVFFAVPLAVFGAEHLAGAQFIAQVVPAWMPARLFWVYFVGCALLAAALSLVLMKYVRWSAILLGGMFFVFVLLIHLPNAAAHPGDRIVWAVALRDLALGGGAWALAGTQTGEWRSHGTSWLVTTGRVIIGAALVFFAVEHFLHPEFAPGVPLRKVTPTWVPIRSFWGYFTGAVLLIAGVAALLKRQVRAAAAWLGIVTTLLVLFIYLPILAVAAQPPAMTEGINYCADTLLFAGTVLLLAAAMPEEKEVQLRAYVENAPPAPTNQ